MTHSECYKIYYEALKNKLLYRPSTCSKCGSALFIEGHHADYDKPLEVTWLCIWCHGDVHHKIIPTGGRGWHHTEEEKRKLSENNKGKHCMLDYAKARQFEFNKIRRAHNWYKINFDGTKYIIE